MGEAPFGHNFVKRTFMICVGNLTAFVRYGGAYTLKKATLLVLGRL